MKNKTILKTVTTNKSYKAALNTGCPICSLGKGCNRNRNTDDSWKSYRKTQWKD